MRKEKNGPIKIEPFKSDDQIKDALEAAGPGFGAKYDGSQTRDSNWEPSEQSTRTCLQEP